MKREAWRGIMLNILFLQSMRLKMMLRRFFFFCGIAVNAILVSIGVVVSGIVITCHVRNRWK